MTDKEFKRLTRPQLIEIIYQLQLSREELAEENRKLKDELADKRLRLHHVGNIAEASLELHNVMQATQAAAAQYLEEIRIMETETKERCERMLKDAQREADSILAQATESIPSFELALDAILKEFGENQ